MKKFELEVFTEEQVKKLAANLQKEKNKVIVETAGFIPLEVKFKQFEQNGIINQLRSSDFTSSDYRDLYLHEDFDVTPEDDLEEAQEKLQKLQQFRNSLQEKIKEKKQNKVSAEKTAESKKSDSAEKKE